MVTQRPTPGTKTPPNGLQPRRPHGDPWADQPSESVWDDAAPRGQMGHPSSLGIRRKPTPDSSRPSGSLPTSSLDHNQEDNVWDEPRNEQSSGYLLERAPTLLVPGGKNSGTNPFIRKPVPRSSNMNHPSSSSSSSAATQPLAESFSKLGLSEPPSGHNPWQSAMDPDSTQTRSQPHSVTLSDMGTDPWARSTPDSPVKDREDAPASPALMSLHSDGSGWEDDSPSHQAKPMAPAKMTAISDDFLREQHVWNDVDGDASRPATGQAQGKELDPQPTGTSLPDDWNLVDRDVATASPLRSPLLGQPDQPDQPNQGVAEAPEKPPLPPRLTGERARWTYSRLPVDGGSETYQVKKIRWYDANSSVKYRLSPILIQNQNGPCPLVALVNALTMTTPADIPDTVLVQVLRSRERVSLTLLLDAVFDELMSPRRTNLEDVLPDISDLYAFLQSLHTGMNVNPRFIPTPELVSAFKHTSLTHLHPTERGNLIPGTFENTLEMGLYAAFSVPLIHGWLPSGDDPAYTAMERHARSYEDVQNLLFREEALENKLGSDIGLSEEEQDLYQDIVTIRMFLESSATQLTAWGIKVIARAMRPGTFAILFRNDHFSTLYCHPENLQLYTLVTDAGYGGHDDIVWESLIDVNGELNQYLTGDFRVRSGAEAASSSSWEVGEDEAAATSTAAGEGKSRRRKSGHRKTIEKDAMSSSVEQEDRDLALALQLQEEEEQRHREEQARRKRETILSERYIEQQARQPMAIPQRRSANGVNIPTATTTTATTAPSQYHRPHPRHSGPIQQVRPLVPPAGRRPGVNRPVNEEDEPPPPSYEQAAQVPAYNPPPGHPTHPGSSATARRAARTSATAGVSPVTASAQRPASVQAGGRRAAAMAPSGGQRERDCILM